MDERTTVEAPCIDGDDPLFGLDNPPVSGTFLYHYTSAVTLDRITESETFLFSNLGRMNDPHEAFEIHPQLHLETTPPLPSCLSVEENQRFRSRDFISEINEERRKVKVGCFALDRDPDLSRFGDDEPFRKTMAPWVALGGRGFAHPRMWAQYADSHRGVCIVFDRAALYSAVETTIGRDASWGCGDVAYARAEYGPSIGSLEIRALLEPGGVRRELVRNHRTAFLEKHPDWADEVEFRFFVVDGSEESFGVPIDPDCVAGIVLGPAINAHWRPTVSRFADRFSIGDKIRLANWPHGTCCLHPVQLSGGDLHPSFSDSDAEVA